MTDYEINDAEEAEFQEAIGSVKKICAALVFAFVTISVGLCMIAHHFKVLVK